MVSNLFYHTPCTKVKYEKYVMYVAVFENCIARVPFMICLKRFVNIYKMNLDLDKLIISWNAQEIISMLMF